MLCNFRLIFNSFPSNLQGFVLSLPFRSYTIYLSRFSYLILPNRVALVYKKDILLDAHIYIYIYIYVYIYLIVTNAYSYYFTDKNLS